MLLHCVHAHTRTPTAAAVYGALVTGSTPAEALQRVVAALPSASPRRSFVRTLEGMEQPA